MTTSNHQDLDLFGEPVAPKTESPKPPTKSVPKAESKPTAAPKAAAAKSVPPANAKPPEQTAKSQDLGPANTASVPDKRYFTISEAAELCATKAHVLRYWESEFKQLSPVKRAGNRRYYQRQDIFLIRQIRELLHEQGFTIAGAKQKLSGENSRPELTKNKQILRELRQELEQLLKSMKA